MKGLSRITSSVLHFHNTHLRDRIEAFNVFFPYLSSIFLTTFTKRNYKSKLSYVIEDMMKIDHTCNIIPKCDNFC